MMHSFYASCLRTSTVSLNEHIAWEAEWPQAVCSVKPIQPLDANDPLLGNNSSEPPVRNGEIVEGSQEVEETGEEDAEGEDDESVGLRFLDIVVH